jgi:hypothetical protein
MLARLVGYVPAQTGVAVPQVESEPVLIVLSPRPMLLPEIVVEGARRGIYGVVGDTGYRALEGVQVALIRGHETAVTDSMGQFAFADLKPGAYVLSLSHPRYRGRLVSVLVPERGGREYSIFLLPRPGSRRDWSDSRAFGLALRQLDARLAWGQERFRITGEELRRYGSLALCDVPRLRVRGWPTPTIVVDGHMVMPEGATLCAWAADDVELVEFGDDPCRDASGTMVEILKGSCGRRGASFGFGTARPARVGYVVVWLRR